MLIQYSKKTTAILIILLLSISGCSENSPNAIDWNTVAPGLTYAHITLNQDTTQTPKELIYVSIDPKKFKFQIYQNSDPKKSKTLKTIQEETKSMLAFNGSFFDANFKPLGLLISSGKELHPISPSELSNGIFTIDKNGDSELTSLQNSEENKQIEPDFAIQNGPILLNQKGKIMFPKETGKTASRTLIGKDKNGNVIVIVLHQSLFQANNTMTLFEIANLLKNAPELKDFGLTSVLNLDGGPSTGIFINNENFTETGAIQNAVTVSAIISP